MYFLFIIFLFYNFVIFGNIYLYYILIFYEQSRLTGKKANFGYLLKHTILTHFSINQYPNSEPMWVSYMAYFNSSTKNRLYPQTIKL